MKITTHECGSVNCGPMAVGCRHCFKGSKMVLFVTGKCGTGCFYCPVSFEKMGKDVVYANERKVRTDAEIIDEARMMGATGTGITGGDPLVNMRRTLKVIRLLKDEFGEEHHIHLYTSTIDKDRVAELIDAGLDEIRFHPPVKLWKSLETTQLGEIAKMKIDVGIEVPALPDYKEELDALITSAKTLKIKFVNLNELEFSESNWDMMKERDYKIRDDISAAVLGSRELALRMIETHQDMRVHFCPSNFKDSVQLRNRLIRRAEHIAQEYDVITDDGTIVRGLAYPEDLNKAIELLKNEYDVPDELMSKDDEHRRLIIASWVLEEIAEELPFKCYISETYPTADALEVERIPLN